jgi:hypothetical protein
MSAGRKPARRGRHCAASCSVSRRFRAKHILREQFRASLGEPHEGPAFMTPEPALGDGKIEAGLVLGGAAALPEERPVDLLNVDTAVLDRLDGVGDLKQLACGLFRIGKWSVGGELHKLGSTVMCAS